MKNKIKKIINNKKGFTIVESLFAIFILVISITGPMAFTQSGLRASFIARDQVTAFYLAQDVIEYIKNVRDHNSIDSIQGADVFWLDGLSDCYSDDTVCTIDTLEQTISACGIAPGCDSYPLVIDGDGYFRGINVTEGTDSIYTREITITPVDDTDINTAIEVEVDVVVKWNTPQTIGEKSINVKENIFNWTLGI